MSEPRLGTRADAVEPVLRLQTDRDDERRARVARLARAVDEGTYRPDAAAIADAVLRHLERDEEPPPPC
ncbi:MAG: flagellar biosynthesis anti-sigma factor FlgM [Thermodesulfobacteriota bacterium]